jgi:hypothetical protein
MMMIIATVDDVVPVIVTRSAFVTGSGCVRVVILALLPVTRLYRAELMTLTKVGAPWMALVL